MDSSVAIDIARQALVTTIILVGPTLFVALVVGCVMSLLQAVTQVQDQAISFVPKLLAVGAVLIVCMPWMTEYFVEYARRVIMQIPSTLIGGS